MINYNMLEKRLEYELMEAKTVEKFLNGIEGKVGEVKYLKHKASMMIEHAEMLELTEDELKLAKWTMANLYTVLQSLEAQHSIAMDYLTVKRRTIEELGEVGRLIKGGVDGLFKKSNELVRSQGEK